MLWIVQLSEAITFYTQSSPLTYAVYPWSVHCECAMKQNKRQILNYIIHTRDTYIVQ